MLPPSDTQELSPNKFKAVTCRSDVSEGSQLRISGVSLELMIITASASLVPRNRVKFQYLEEVRTFSLAVRFFFLRLVFVAYGELAWSSVLKRLKFSLVFPCLRWKSTYRFPPVRKLDLSVSRRGGHNKGGRKQTRANENKRRQTLTNTSKRRGANAQAKSSKRGQRKQTLTPPNYFGFLHPPLQSP